MTTSERGIQRDIQLACAEVKGLRLWRANVGRGWVGVNVGNRIEEGRKYLTLADPRPLDTGLPEGFPDLFGFIEDPGQPTLQANGLTYAVPASITVFVEVKTPTGRVSPKQQAFIDAARAAGCRAGIARSVADALKIVRGEM